MDKLLALLLILAAAAGAAAAAINCTRRCGDIQIPFPFGITGDAPGCYLQGFNLDCDSSTLRSYSYSIEEFRTINLSSAEATVLGYKIINECGVGRVNVRKYDPKMDLTGSPFTFSTNRNNLTAIGCQTIALFDGTSDRHYSTGCVSLCTEDTELSKVTSCAGFGCCQVAMPPLLQFIDAKVYTFPNYQGPTQPWNNCSLAFVGSEYTFQTSDVNETDFITRNGGPRVPVVLDWSIGNAGCREAQINKTSYACISKNSECFNARNGFGYLCKCSDGFQGNPYMSDGCMDIDECLHPELHNCSGECFNSPGSYSCVSDTKITETVVIASVSAGTGSVLLVAAIAGLWKYLKKRSVQKRKKRFYQQNLDLLVKEQPSDYSDIPLVHRMKIYELEELEKATNHFDKARVIGGGGHGQVYKGILSDQRVVAIKKPKITNQNELGQFLNEVFILSQTNHRNVVKFFGCCLQTQVPLLVFEFVSGGTLSNHLVGGEDILPLSFDDRLRIATEIANALSYLHTAAATTIFHRDVKSTNILLDEKNTVKLADFGASRSVALEQTSIFTAVQGTYGYLDPEYHQTGKLTEKSDVYSFGVILVELLCGRTATPYRTHDMVPRTVVMDLLDALAENALYNILDPLVLREGSKETIEGVASLAQKCLRLSGKERPTIKDVENELETLRCRKQKSSDDDNNGARASQRTTTIAKGSASDALIVRSLGSTITTYTSATTLAETNGSILTTGNYFSDEMETVLLDEYDH